MAAIIFNTAHPVRHVREQLKAVVAVLQKVLDAFVSNRMQRAAAEAEQGHPERPRACDDDSSAGLRPGAKGFFI
jgi:hypothetical protein